MIKNKAYCVRLNQQLVEKVKAVHGKSPQKLLDDLFEEFHELWNESEDPERAKMGRPFGAKTVNKKKVEYDTDLDDI